MKTHNFIGINKSDMNKVHHWDSTDDVIGKFYHADKMENIHNGNWIIIKEESRVVDLREIEDHSDFIAKVIALRKILKES